MHVDLAGRGRQSERACDREPACNTGVTIEAPARQASRLRFASTLACCDHRTVSEDDVEVPPHCPAEAAAHYRRTLLDAVLRAERSEDGVWIFGYASLIWRPEFHAEETRRARVVGWHRALRMRSRVNRGTPERPGLVFALFGGGSCVGVVSRVSRDNVCQTLQKLWGREMPMPVYEPRWLRCSTDAGEVHALAFTLDRRHPSHTGVLDDPTMLNILRHARGRYGSTLDYLVQTHLGLVSVGIEDREVARLVALARGAGLLNGTERTPQALVPPPLAAMTT